VTHASRNPLAEGQAGVQSALTVWSGAYRFAMEDPFFRRASWVGQRYVDRKGKDAVVSESSFRSEMDELRETAPHDAEVLLEDLEHRWLTPQAPPTLYVLDCALVTESSCVFQADGRRLGRRVTCTKVGEALRSLAGRLTEYDRRRILGQASITPQSLVLRAVIFGYGDLMLSETEVQRVARANGSPLMRFDKSGRRLPGSSETYVGGAIVEAICAFARQRAPVTEAQGASGAAPSLQTLVGTSEPDAAAERSKGKAPAQEQPETITRQLRP
jgi:hypothetical protein